MTRDEAGLSPSLAATGPRARETDVVSSICLVALTLHRMGDHLCLPWRALEMLLAFGFRRSDRSKYSSCNIYCVCNTVSEQLIFLNRFDPVSRVS